MFQELKTYNFDMVHGYNRFELDIPFMVPKGSMILAETSHSSQIAVDPRGTNIYSDLKIIGNILKPINGTQNNKFHINCLISNPFYTITYRLQHKFMIFGKYNITAKYDKISNVVQRAVDIANGINILILILSLI